MKETETGSGEFWGMEVGDEGKERERNREQ
jgi:hypothetical protein